MSEGGRSATMPHGIYNVINHTTGERFENIVIGSGMSIPAGFDGTNLPRTSQLPEQAYDALDALPPVTVGPQPQVPETIWDGHTTIRLEPGETFAGTLDNAVTNGLLVGAGAIGSALQNGAPWQRVVLAGLGGLASGFGGTVLEDVEVVTESDYIDNDIVYQSPPRYDAEDNVTTTATTHRDGTYITRVYDHTTGTVVTRHTDAGGHTTTTITHPDDELEPHLQPEPTSSRTDPNRNSSSETDSNYGGSQSHQSGGLSSGTGNQTSNNPHTA